MARPLELSYHWQPAVLVTTVGLILCAGLLARNRPPGWGATLAVLVVGWLVLLGVIWLRTRAFLLVDGSQLTIRRYRSMHRIEGADLVRVRELMTPSGGSYALTVRTADGALVRHVAPTAVLRKGHSTLFAWILTAAPGAELDKGSRRTLQDLQDRGLVPGTTP
jgi:hypothetical protein